MSSSASMPQCPDTSPSSDSSLSRRSRDGAPVAIEHNSHANQSPNFSGDSKKPQDKSMGSNASIITVPVSERKLRFLEPDGRLQSRFSILAHYAIFKLRQDVLEDQIEFRLAFLTGKHIETIISAHGRSGVWTTFADKPSTPKGWVRIPPATAADLIAKGDALVKQLYVRRPTYETANRFCAALREVMQPLVEQYLSGSLQLTRRLPWKTVAVMPSDVRAALAKAINRADTCMENNRLSEKAVKQVLEAIDVALEAIGRPATPSEPHESPGPAIPEYDGYITLMPGEFKFTKRRLAAGTLELASLRHKAEKLRHRLRAQKRSL